jgi:hypothetical protein
MIDSGRTRTTVVLALAFAGLSASLLAQPAASPLGVQGMDQWLTAGARSRSMGSTRLAGGTDATALFSNPAALSNLTSIEVRVGGSFAATDQRQDQSWVPLKNLPGLSLLFEGQARSIKAPVDALGQPLTPWATLQKPYDDIEASWRRRTSGGLPEMAVIAAPYTIGGISLTAGLGVSRAVELDHRYQNNNAMDPYLGHERPYAPWSNAIDTVHVKWYQYLRSREGDMYGVTPAVSIRLTEDILLGASLTVLRGSSDDLEERRERGHLNIAVAQGEAKDFMVDTVRYTRSAVGSSSYAGTLFTAGLVYRQPRFSVGVTFRPGATLTRSWDRTISIVDTTVKSYPVRIDSLAARQWSESGEDRLAFPHTLSIGIVLRPTDRWTVAFDYERRDLGAVERTGDGFAGIDRPWIGSTGEWRLGAEYRVADWIAVRAGYHEAAGSFAPDGAALVDQPVRSSVLATGAGLDLGAIGVDVAYEYRTLKYQDLYQSNINANATSGHRFLAEIAYRF